MITFFQEFFRALGISLGNNLAAIVSLIGVAFILYILLTSKKARIIISSLKDAIIKQLMIIPFVAESVYNKTIQNYEKDLKDWNEYLKDLNAELTSYKTSIEENQQTIKQYTKKVKSAMEMQDEALAMEYAEQVVIAQDDNKMLEEKHIPRIERAITATNERMSDLRTLIIRTKARKKDALRNMKGGKLEERLTDNLSENNENSSMLAFFEERAEYQRNRGTGARMTYESSLEYKDKKLDRAMLRDSASQLLETYRRDALPTGKR